MRTLHGVDLEIGQGMFGLLGPNGAGKTTLMRIIVGVLEADRGSIKINERHLKEHREAFHGAIGYLPQDFGLYENMTPVEYRNYHALTNGIYEHPTRHELIEKLAKERIVIFSTHIVEDISSTCHDLAVLSGGRVIYCGSPEAMQKKAQGKVFEAVIPEEEFSNWRENLQIVQHSKSDHGIRMRFLSEAPVAGLEAETVEPTLEDAYVYLLQ
ncbi:MAG: ATP-binding cassette domain-containing protein [candidate division KSB1 bacterium]|nr:ATP-binding cassette domain-containing protein [candidate division KSB1 bacterium]MDZ7368994.1 ATP-binding cassette domain-containing protein [candidate division KSB1 bacterium]MDZ7406968.1 ATP-binding cassette domain-containing protein [candidate division KSB1 bacterium]